MFDISYKKLENELEKLKELSQKMRTITIENNTSSYYLKPKLIKIAKKNLLERENNLKNNN